MNLVLVHQKRFFSSPVKYFYGSIIIIIFQLKHQQNNITAAIFCILNSLWRHVVLCSNLSKSYYNFYYDIQKYKNVV